MKYEELCIGDILYDNKKDKFLLVVSAGPQLFSFNESVSFGPRVKIDEGIEISLGEHSTMILPYAGQSGLKVVPSGYPDNCFTSLYENFLENCKKIGTLSQQKLYQFRMLVKYAKINNNVFTGLEDVCIPLSDDIPNINEDIAAFEKAKEIYHSAGQLMDTIGRNFMKKNFPNIQLIDQ